MPTEQLKEALRCRQESFSAVVPFDFDSQGTAIDLSSANQAVQAINSEDTQGLQSYIWQEMEKHGAVVCAGGYQEHRESYYERGPAFVEQGEQRAIHMGVDIWAAAGTPVMAPLDGQIHSFRNNTDYGDYGPTIILHHEVDGISFHTLYGHLSIPSVQDKKVGEEIKAGEQFADLGDPSVNGDWPPHLHFQIVIDMQGMNGDFQGVCSRSQHPSFRQNCPDPNLILGFEALEKD